MNQQANLLTPLAVLSLAGSLTRLPLKDTPGCEVCKSRSKAVCDEFVKVRERAISGGMSRIEAEAAINKICVAVGAESSLLNITRILQNDNADFISSLSGMISFLKDVNQNQGTKALDGNLAALSDVNWFKSWNMVYEALKPTDSQLRRDWETLETVRVIISNEVSSMNHLFAVINASTDAEIVGAKNGSFSLKLQTFLKRYSVADCQLCGNASNYGIPTLKDIWANSIYMLGLYDSGLTDAQKLLNGGTFLSSVFSMKSGTNHMILDMRSRNLSRASIAGLDNAFAAGGKEYDLKRSNSGGFIEYKSYTEDYGLNEVTGIGSGSWKDFDQFLAYLAQPEVTDLGGVSLEYVFSAKKIQDVGLIKEQFKKMMYNSVNKTLTEQGNKVFDVIWGNNGLRETLFGEIADPIIGKDRFTKMVADTTLSLYSFIKVK